MSFNTVRPLTWGIKSLYLKPTHKIPSDLALEPAKRAWGSRLAQSQSLKAYLRDVLSSIGKKAVVFVEIFNPGTSHLDL